MQTVTVRLFAALREVAGAREIQLSLPEGASVADLRKAVGERVATGPYAVALNREFVPDEVVIAAGDDLALIPPVSGGSRRIHVDISAEPLSLDRLVRQVGDPGAGAVVTFSGVTRDVGWLDYEAYREMAVEQIARIVQSAVERFELLACACEHRVGRVPRGEPSVIVAASSPHRPEAFAGARYVIDEVKATVTIWKAEEGRWGEGVLPA